MALQCPFRAGFGKNAVVVSDEIKQAPSQKLLGDCSWVRRDESFKQDTAFTVLAANLSPQGFIGLADPVHKENKSNSYYDLMVTVRSCHFNSIMELY